MENGEIKKLLNDRILIEPAKNKVGIIISLEDAKETQGVGFIRMLGEKVYHAHEDEKLVVGMKVMYGKMAGFDIDYQDKPMKMIRSGDVSAILEE